MANQPAYPGIERITDPAIKDAVRLTQSMVHQTDRIMKGVIGTLNPDTKPTKTLKVSDAGLRFLATDYNREFLWDGAKWTDAPGTQARNSIVFMPLNESPGNGWARATGADAPRSTPDGRIERFQTPAIADVNGLKAWVRL